MLTLHNGKKINFYKNYFTDYFQNKKGFES